MIAGFEVRIKGQPLDETIAEHVVEVRVDDNLTLPDAFSFRISDPTIEHVDKSPFEVGAEVEILFSSADGSTFASMLKGQIAAVEPEFSVASVFLVVRGYDHSHQLNRTRRSETYQNMTVADIARKVIGRTPSLSVGTIDDAGGVQDFTQQQNETDWEFLWRLATLVDFEVAVLDKTFHFRKAQTPGQTVTLRWGETLQSFRPRVTGVQQLDEVVVRGWDPKTKDVIEASAKVGTLASEIGIDRASVSKGLGGGTLRVGERPVSTPEEAAALAKSIVARLGNAFLEGDGTALGDPTLKAGAKVKVEGIGTRFSGTYALSSTRHVHRGSSGYHTQFAISGRAPRTLVDLMTPSAPRTFAGSVAIGLVTNNDDPDGMGRVRVKYPALGEQTEGWWARIAAPGAGKGRGQLMTPLVGDEVLVAFEHGDMRKPYVIGGLWNAKEQPTDLVQTDGSYALASDKKLIVTAKDDVSLKGDAKYSLKSSGDMTVETDGKISQKASGEIAVQGQRITVKADTSVTIEAGSTLTIKGVSLTIEGTSVSVKADGIVQLSGSQIMLG